jgi:hypothetical protein
VLSCTGSARNSARSRTRCRASATRRTIVEPEGRQHDFQNPRSGLTDPLQRPHQLVYNGDLVVFIGSDTGGSEIRRLRIRANPAILTIQGGDVC